MAPDRAAWAAAILTTAMLVGTAWAVTPPDGGPDGCAPPGLAWVGEGRLFPDDPGSMVHYGFALALDGDVAAVHARDNWPPASTPVEVLHRTAPGTWEHEALLTIPDHNLDWTPRVAVDGDHLFISSHTNGDRAFLAGAVHVFERSGDGTWSPAGRLYAADASAVAYFGRTVAAGDGVLAVAAYSPSISSLEPGYVYIFEQDAQGDWTQVAKLVGSEAVRTDMFGYALAVHDGRVLIGAPRHDAGWNDAGAGYVFARDGQGAWVQEAKLTYPDAYPAKMGVSAALDGDVAVLGSIVAEAAVVHRRGADGTWAHEATLVNPEVRNDDYGSSLALDGDRLAVGIALDDEAGFNAGAVLSYHFDEDQGWILEQTLLPENSGGLGRGGLAMDGETLIASAPFDAQHRGAGGSVHVYSLDSDRDGLTDYAEAAVGSDPLDPDTDDEGLLDGPEVCVWGTDPLDPDTDGDLHGDRTEVDQGSDPANPLSLPTPLGPVEATDQTRGMELPVTDDLAPLA